MVYLRSFLLAAVISALVVQPAHLHAHCQVPCGIFDDHAEVMKMMQDSVTAAKAITELTKLADKTDTQSLNQKVRWINNKEVHAQKIMFTIADYFMAQRVKTSMPDYNERLVKHHAVMIAAMKVKQSADMAAIDHLNTTLQALLVYYPHHPHTH